MKYDQHCKQQPRILFFIDSLTAGGAQRQVVAIAGGFTAIGYDTHVLTYYNINDFAGDSNISRVNFHCLERRCRFDFGYIFRLRCYLKTLKPAVVISYLTVPNILVRLALLGARDVAVFTSERNIDLVNSRTMLAIERILVRYSEKVITNTDTARSMYLAAIHVPDEKVCTIYNGVDERKYVRQYGRGVANCSRDLRRRSDGFLIVLPGRIVPQKNPLCLLDAIFLMGELAGSIDLVFVGKAIDEDLVARIKSQARAYGLSRNIKFTGVRTDMADVYSAADVVVLPSDWEGLPNVLLEAMACEAVVVASRIADNTKIVDDRINGFLFERGNAAELKDILVELKKRGEAERRAIGIMARRKVLERFSAKACLDNYASLVQGYM